MALDQFELPRPSPFLELLFPKDGGPHSVMELGEDKPIDAIVLNKPATAFDRCCQMRSAKSLVTPI